MIDRSGKTGKPPRSARASGALRAVAVASLGAAAFAVLAAPLPGEMQGCGGDTSGTIDASTYCVEKCEVEASAKRRCGLIVDDDIYEQQLVDYCVDTRHCDAPVICYGWSDFFISNSEADECFEAISVLDCQFVEELNDNPPVACQEDELCDPQ